MKIYVFANLHKVQNKHSQAVNLVRYDRHIIEFRYKRFQYAPQNILDGVQSVRSANFHILTPHGGRFTLLTSLNISRFRIETPPSTHMYRLYVL